jgi:multidrug efflux system membrane fusion protein
MRSVTLSLTAALLISAVACGKGEAPPPSGGASPGASSGRGGGPAVPVSIADVVERAMPVTIRAVGTVEASSTVDIHSQVAGPILSIGFKEGADVKAGELLFTIDPRPFQGIVNNAESALRRDTAQLNNLQAQLQRAEDLFARGIVTKADRDTLAANVASMAATVSSDNGTLEAAKLQLSYTKIAAPVAGRTGALMVHQGSLVRANDTMPMVTINVTAPVNVTFAVPAKLLSRLRGVRAPSDLRVTASIPGVAESTSTGSLGFIDSAADPSTDTVKVKGVFPNGNRTLWPGQYVDVSMQLSVEQHALVVPTSAVQSSQQGQFVYVVNNNVAEVKPVTVAWIDGSITVVERGVASGDKVVTDGQLRLTPGAKVSIKPAVPAARQ